MRTRQELTELMPDLKGHIMRMSETDVGMLVELMRRIEHEDLSAEGYNQIAEAIDTLLGGG